MSAIPQESDVVDAVPANPHWVALTPNGLKAVVIDFRRYWRLGARLIIDMRQRMLTKEIVLLPLQRTGTHLVYYTMTDT
jgi:hypothetical protein